MDINYDTKPKVYGESGGDDIVIVEHSCDTSPSCSLSGAYQKNKNYPIYMHGETTYGVSLPGYL